MDPRILNLGVVVGTIVAAGLLGIKLRLRRRARTQQRYDLW